LPILDLLLELANYYISKLASGISIDTQRIQLKFKEEFGLNKVDDGNRIGFVYPTSSDDYDEEEYEEESEDRCKRK
jgi:hypothetical protein